MSDAQSPVEISDIPRVRSQSVQDTPTPTQGVFDLRSPDMPALSLKKDSVGTGSATNLDFVRSTPNLFSTMEKDTHTNPNSNVFPMTRFNSTSYAPQSKTKADSCWSVLAKSMELFTKTHRPAEKTRKWFRASLLVTAIVQIAGLTFMAMSTQPIFVILYGITLIAVPIIGFYISMIKSLSRIITWLSYFGLLLFLVVLSNSFFFVVFTNWYLLYCGPSRTRTSEPWINTNTSSGGVDILSFNSCTHLSIDVGISAGSVVTLLINMRHVVTLLIGCQRKHHIMADLNDTDERQRTVSSVLEMEHRPTFKSKNTMELTTIAEYEAEESETLDRELQDTVRLRFYPQMALIYVSFVLVIAVAAFTWASLIDIQNVVPYVVTCFCCLEASRYFLARRLGMEYVSAAPLYFNLFPQATLIFISREAHIIISLLFFFSTFLIQLQVVDMFGSHEKENEKEKEKANEDKEENEKRNSFNSLDSLTKPKSLHTHLILYVLLYGVVYMGSTAGIGAFFADTTGQSLYMGPALVVAIDWISESVVTIVTILAGISLAEVFRLHTSALFQHIKAVKTLLGHNKALIKHVKTLEQSSGRRVPQLDVPIEKATGALLGLLRSGGFDSATKKTITTAVKLINETNVFAPDLSNVDDESIHPDIRFSNPRNRLLLGNSNSFSIFSGETVSRQITIERMASFADSSTHFDLDKATIEHVLTKLEESDCDMFELKAEIGRPVFHVGLALIFKHGLTDKLKLDEKKLCKFMSKLESGYQSNPYHNSTHAADVASTFDSFIHGGLGKYLSEIEVLGGLLACCVHDYEHPGLNNPFHVSAQTTFALTYNDKSVLENHHASAASRLLKTEEYDFLSGLTPAQRKEIRKLMINMVLATDLASHFEIFGKFKAKLTSENLDPAKPDDKLLIMEVAMKCADVSNPTKSVPMATVWSSCILTEFFRQGDIEKELGMEVSKGMDRSNPDVIKSQVGFNDFICRPLFEHWGMFLQTQKFVTAIDENIEYWAKMEGSAADSLPQEIMENRKLLVGVRWPELNLFMANAPNIDMESVEKRGVEVGKEKEKEKKKEKGKKKERIPPLK